MTSYVMAYKAVSHVTLPRMRELYPIYIPNSLRNIFFALLIEICIILLSKLTEAVKLSK
jgi:hypothetical protein